MKKIILLVASVLCFASAASAQSFGVGTKTITGTVGLGGVSGLPIALSYEQGVYEFAPEHQLGAGAYIGISKYMIAPAAECNYHYVGFDKFDLYAGIRIGIALIDDYSTIFSSYNIGMNYSLNSKWAINAELGDGMGALTLGVSYRL